MEDFRRKYDYEMQPQTSSYQERFSITEARSLKDNLDKGIYEDALEYLTGTGED